MLQPTNYDKEQLCRLVTAAISSIQGEFSRNEHEYIKAASRRLKKIREQSKINFKALRDRVIQDQMRAPEARLSRNIRDTILYNVERLQHSLRFVAQFPVIDRDLDANFQELRALVYNFAEKLEVPTDAAGISDERTAILRGTSSTRVLSSEETMSSDEDLQNPVAPVTSASAAEDEK